MKRKMTLVITTLLLMATADIASAVSWEGLPGKEIGLFYPGQAAWEWVLTPADHGGAKKFREGKNCRDCHEGEEADIGAKRISSEKSQPIAGKPGAIKATITATRDADTLYFRIEWLDPGTAGKGNSKTQSRVTLMIGSESIKEAARAGCWAACHADVKSMASDAGLTKYLPASRIKLTRTGGGDNYKSEADIAALLQADQFLEMWQVKLTPGAPAVAADGYILKDFHMNDTAIVNAEAGLVNGKWTVVLQRALNAEGVGRRPLKSGVTYPVGIAIHSNFADERHHYVSLEHTLAIDSGEADFVARNR